MPRLILENEERRRRRRARWARQAAQRRKPDGEFKAPAGRSRAHRSRAGVPNRNEKLLSDAEMDCAWRRFWSKRGLADLPPVTTAGVTK